MNKLTSSFRDLVADAEKEIETLSPAQVRAALDSSTGGLLLVDLRDVREVKREGRIAGSCSLRLDLADFIIDTNWRRPSLPNPSENLLANALGILNRPNSLPNALSVTSILTPSMSIWLLSTTLNSDRVISFRIN